MSPNTEVVPEVVPKEFTFVLDGQKYLAMPIDPVLELQIELEVETRPAAENLSQKDFLLETDTWEPEVSAWVPRSDIVTRLIVRRTDFGISCHLNVHIGNSEPCDLASGAGSVSQIREWLGSFDTGLNIANRLGMQDSDALALCKRWLEVFTKPLQRWEALPDEAIVQLP